MFFDKRKSLKKSDVLRIEIESTNQWSFKITRQEVCYKHLCEILVDSNQCYFVARREVYALIYPALNKTTPQDQTMR